MTEELLPLFYPGKGRALHTIPSSRTWEDVNSVCIARLAVSLAGFLENGYTRLSLGQCHKFKHRDSDEIPSMDI